ncbi:hypothetical protein [Levilactobacillus enshiensis]|nr:hypothetical protein [Levilactobacillus enshiensis]
MKKLINVLWAIEKDLRIIANNTKVLRRESKDEIRRRQMMKF